MKFQECSAYATYVGCDGHVPVHGFCNTLPLQSHVQWFEANYRKLLHIVVQSPGLLICFSDVMISYDSHRVIPKFIASIGVALIPMCKECCLA